MNYFSVGFLLLRSLLLTKKLVDSGTGRLKLATPFLNVKIIKKKGSQVTLNGRLSLTPNLGGNAPISIIMGTNSKLTINGDFVLGDGVKIFINDNAELIIGGRELEFRSGITSNVIVMVYKKITIGKDFLCSWNVFISDSDWHIINETNFNKDINIGDHVWVGNNCSILKGSIIGNNCIISSFSKLVNKNYPENIMIGGIPAKIIKQNVSWKYC